MRLSWKGDSINIKYNDDKIKMIYKKKRLKKIRNTDIK